MASKFRIILLCFIILSVNMNIYTVYGEDKEQTKIPIIISLGDSYSSGEGVEPFYDQDNDRTNSADWLAHRSTKSWPSLLHISELNENLGEYKDENWYFVAASGATTKNLEDKQKKSYNKDGNKGTFELDPQIKIFDDIGENSVDYVTMTFGGNDVGFTDIIQTAAITIPYLNPRKLSDKLQYTWDKFYKKNGTRKDIQDAYSLICKKAGPNAKIIVAGYPQLLNNDGKGFFFTKNNAQEINANVSKFNKELSKLINECNKKGNQIYFVPVEDAFAGHEAYSYDSYINKIFIIARKQDLTNGPISKYSMHPNEKGITVYAECVQEKINEIERNESNKEDNALKNKINNEFDKVKKNIGNWLEQKIEETLNNILPENCDG